MGEIEEDEMGFELCEGGFNGGSCEVHGGHEEGEESVGDVVCGFGGGREAGDVRDVDGEEGDEMRMEIERREFGLRPGGDEEGDSVASLGQLVGDVEEGGEMAHGEPGVHGYVKLNGHVWKYDKIWFGLRKFWCSLWRVL